MRSWLRLTVFVAVVFVETYNLLLPSYWGDETATISGSTRTLANLWRLVQHIDAVHGSYYLFMHFWLQLAGVSPLTVRLPSAIAVSVAVTLVFVILRKRTNLVSALAATAAFALMPRVIWAAGIGRSYAFTILFGAVLIWLLLRIVEASKPRAAWFVAYALVASVASLVFVYAILMVAAQGLALLVLKTPWSKLWRFALSALPALAVAVPLALYAQGQSFQIAWMRHMPTGFFERVFGNVLFYSDPWLSLLVWGLAAFGVFSVIRVSLRARKSRAGNGLVGNGLAGNALAGNASIAVQTLMVALLPALVVYVYSLQVKPIYDGRYFSFAAAAVAILFGFGVHRLRFNGLQLLAGVLVVVLSIGPAYFWRQEFRYGNDQNKVAELIQKEAHRGDGLLIAPISKNCSAACLTVDAFEAELSKVKVLGLKNEKLRAGWLHDQYMSAGQTLKRTGKFKRIWLVHTLPGNPLFEHPLLEGLTAQGFKPGQSFNLKFETITLYSR